MLRLIFSLLVLMPLIAVAGQAGVVSLLERDQAGQGRGVLFQTSGETGLARSGSLFIGRAKGGMFQELPAHVPAFPAATAEGLQGSDVATIRALIGRAESRRDGYDAVQHGARTRTPRPPTQMSIAEIFEWIADTPGQPHAIGRFQFVPKTLARVVKKTGISRKARYSPAVQDQLADVLLAEAGLKRFRNGDMSRVAFMNNLAKIWAGLPNSSGKSHYHGYAGNKASITWAQFEAVMVTIAPG
ncbi:MAG: hypothetical protein WBB25_08445 [Sulfitobacter sp.]